MDAFKLQVAQDARSELLYCLSILKALWAVLYPDLLKEDNIQIKLKGTKSIAALVFLFMKHWTVEYSNDILY